MNWFSIAIGFGAGFLTTFGIAAGGAIHVARHPEVIMKVMFAQSRKRKVREHV